MAATPQRRHGPHADTHTGENIPDVLDQTMTRDDLVFVLQHLNFDKRTALAPLYLDKDARDYLIDRLKK